MYKKLHKQQAGVVSMITVIFLSVILLVLTTSFIQLTINEQRESIDNDLTTRAYYAAESGVQDAITAISNITPTNPLQYPTECAPEGSGVLSDAANGLDTEYTCQLIDLSPINYQAKLDKYKSEFFKLDGGGPNIDSVLVSWHINGHDDSGDVTRRSSFNLPSEADWTAGHFPALMRVQIVTVPTTVADTVNRDTIENFVVFLNPEDLATGSVSGIVNSAALDSKLVRVLCDNPASTADGEYICNYTLTGLADGTHDYYIRVQALYDSTSIQIVAKSGGVAVELQNAQAIVDVTGRAADVFRRVEDRVNLSPDDLWPDYVIMTAEEICKNFTITDVVDDGGVAGVVDFSDVNAGIAGSCK